VLYQTKSVFIDPFTDFGFKYLFGREECKFILVDLLNALLKPEKKIVQITYLQTEQLGLTEYERKAVFDIYCTDEEGSVFIIEMQQAFQAFFKARSLFYSIFPIRSQGKKGDWDFNLKKTYTICFVDFKFDDTHPHEMVHYVKLIDTKTNEVFIDLLSFLFVEMPKFKKREHELITREDQWFYVLRNLIKLKEIPLFLSNDPVFKQFFMNAEEARLANIQLHGYYLSQKAKWDKRAQIKGGILKGLEEGLQKGIEKGMEKGMEKGIKKGLRKGLQKGIEQGIEQGIEKGIEKGIEQGVIKGKLEAAESLLKNTNFSVEEISKLVNIDIEFVKKIKISV
jgi:predicted transposase/invertase (TIGR01784 family)